ncbi:enoyl-CoA hydratase-related protein [Streptomyces boninensis]|uniref:enoyl-CoA hydratase-related protein n=1 Tax=Streptomyces boninensis TaxID=2039455 RepID=UPI003B212530
MEHLKLEREGAVVTARLHRPEVLNALSSTLMTELTGALRDLDQDPEIGCFIITGSDRAFAAGADIREMAPKSAAEMAAEDYFAGWDALAALRTPTVAAVSGYALGGGCELAMMCDLVIAADTAVFGQPELALGVIPGIGGTQRLVRAVGKAKAMDMILTGRTMDAAEAERAGLVARVVPAADLAAEARKVATAIAARTAPAVRAALEAMDRAQELPLREGLLFERRLFHALFATEDQKEGMRAFLEKRAPHFTGR